MEMAPSSGLPWQAGQMLGALFHQCWKLQDTHLQTKCSKSCGALTGRNGSGVTGEGWGDRPAPWASLTDQAEEQCISTSTSPSNRSNAHEYTTCKNQMLLGLSVSECPGQSWLPFVKTLLSTPCHCLLSYSHSLSHCLVLNSHHHEYLRHYTRILQRSRQGLLRDSITRPYSQSGLKTKYTLMILGPLYNILLLPR